MNTTIRCFFLLLAAPLPVIATTASAAATSPMEASSPAANAAQELEEILVRGKKLKVQIAEAEDEFFALFNRVNTDDDYDTSCVYLNLDTEGNSTIKSRVCLPGFVADAITQSIVSKYDCTDFIPRLSTDIDYDKNRDGRISWREVADIAAVEDSARQAGDTSAGNVNSATDLKARFSRLDRNHDGYLTVVEYAERISSAATPSNCYQAPPPQLVLMEGTQKWYEHSMQVINSDPRLQKMAGHLDDLYHELFAEESRLQEAQAARSAESVPVVAKPNPGPRGR